jgi:FixJ family two-component response regulator
VTAEAATVVVVDDDVSIRRGLARLLKALCYRAQTFASARDFLERADIGRVGCCPA